MRRIRISRVARRDLLDIWTYIADSDIEAADALLDRIDALCGRLQDTPLLGRSRDELAPGIRSIPVARYMIYYRLSGSRLEVARVLHAARDLDLLF